MEENIELGGNIKLSGFSDLEGGEMVIVKKIVGNHVKRISELRDNIEEVKINLKTIHATEASKKYELHASVIADKSYNSEITDRNLYFGIDKVMKKIIAMIS